MRLTFLGATHEVTGSCYYLEAAGKKFLVDCGMEQGPNIYENKPIPVPASQLDFVLITHAHIDHTGNLPLLYAHGFRGHFLTHIVENDSSGQTVDKLRLEGLLDLFQHGFPGCNLTAESDRCLTGKLCTGI